MADLLVGFAVVLGALGVAILILSVIGRRYSRCPNRRHYLPLWAAGLVCTVLAEQFRFTPGFAIAAVCIVAGLAIDVKAVVADRGGWFK